MPVFFWFLVGLYVFAAITNAAEIGSPVRFRVVDDNYRIVSVVLSTFLAVGVFVYGGAL